MSDSLPQTTPDKIGILLANLGTPDGYDYWSMRRYLGEFLSDKRVIDYPAWKWQPLLQLVILSKRPFTSGADYKSIWNHEADESPLMTITKAQTSAIANRMQATHGDGIMVDFCMRYGTPSTRSKLRRMVNAGCRKILFFPLYPQYAGATTASANDAFFAALGQEKWQPETRTIDAYCTRKSYIDALAQSIETHYQGLGWQPDILVCSYHGMPKRYIAEGDPYYDQCLETTRLLQNRLGWGDTVITSTFQSQFGPEEWLQPYTIEKVARLAKSGKKNLAICSPAFSADCIETLFEIEEEIKEGFEAAGGRNFTYIPCLNDGPAHINALCDVIDQNLQGWLA
ncbi:MAG: ferrochelatase [Rhodobacteraceae bacterium]|nr:ferrochelatase [Paracoccaceae bacterium]